MHLNAAVTGKQRPLIHVVAGVNGVGKKGCTLLQQPFLKPFKPILW